MKSRLLKIALLFILFLSEGLCLTAEGIDKDDIILIIASYNPDTKRMNSFTTGFESEVEKQNISCQILIEDMGCKGIDEVVEWKSKMANVLQKYNKKSLKAIILLGQEAFASMLMQENIPFEIPMLTCFVSQNGIKLPVHKIEKMEDWLPESVNMTQWADSLGVFGGVNNVYDIDENIALIRSLYPKTQHIAFVSDNTYGGISLQALVKKRMKKYLDLDLILIDTHAETAEDAIQKVASLPHNTTMLIGTWRVDKNGEYFLNSNLDKLLFFKPNIPVFSLSGTGLGSVALGGYIPDYDKNNAKEVARQIIEFYRGNVDSVCFKSNENKYLFDQDKLKSAGIREYQLPPNSKFIDNTKEQLRKYRTYIYIGSFALIVAMLVLVILYGLLYRNKKLQKTLIRREKELINAKDQAEESDRLKSSFLANMSHEIRTPLNAIVGFSSLLAEEELSTEEKGAYSKIINTNSELLLTLINDILEISRLETGQAKFSYQLEDIDELCNQVMTTTLHLRKNDIEYVYKPSDVEFRLNTDRQRLLQVLINLMTNANKFTDHGQIVLSYEVQRDRNCVLFTVSDTGCGIPKEKILSLFTRFRKLNENKQGTGLGLSICKHIASTFGGDIWIDPDYSPGVRIFFSHPIEVVKRKDDNCDS